MTSAFNDKRLFVEQAGWFGPYLPQPTIHSFACWLAPWLRGQTRRGLADLLQLNHPVQLEGEKALIAILDAAPTRAKGPTVREQCGRNVDWPATLLRSYPFQPTTFVHGRDGEELDNGLLHGLATIAKQWVVMLTQFACFPDTHVRVRALREAARPFGTPGTLTAGHIRRLGRLPGKLQGRGAALREALQLSTRPLRGPGAREALLAMASQLEADPSVDQDNANDALEVSVILSIARAAQEAGWSVVPTKVVDGGKPILKLEKNEYRCEIRKGSFQTSAHPHRHEDALQRLEREAIGLKAGTRQPDVVVAFWEARRPSQVAYCFADAKRNVTGDGIGYLKKSVTAMTAYMVAFADPLGARLDPAAGGFSAPIMPTATLFMSQSGTTVAGASAHEQHAVVARLLAEDTVPWLVALDERSYACWSGRAWDSVVVRAWFTRVSREGLRSLGARRDVALPLVKTRMGRTGDGVVAPVGAFSGRR